MDQAGIELTTSRLRQLRQLPVVQHVRFTELSRIKQKTWTRQSVPMINIHTYIHTDIHTYIHTYIHTCMHAYIHACMHTYIRTHVHTYIHTYIHTCLLLLISMLWHSKRYSNLKETSCLPLLKAGFEPGSLKAPNRQQTECPLTNRLSYRGSSWKTWTQQPVPMMSEHSAHLTSLPFGFRTWLWRYTCLLLLISMLWHRQAIFESKGDKLSSSAESRIRTWNSQGT